MITISEDALFEIFNEKLLAARWLSQGYNGDYADRHAASITRQALEQVYSQIMEKSSGQSNTPNAEESEASSRQGSWLEAWGCVSGREGFGRKIAA